MERAGNLRGILDSWPPIMRPPSGFRPRRIAIVERTVSKELGRIEARPPTSVDLDALRRRTLAAWRQHPPARFMRELSPRDRKRLPWVLFGDRDPLRVYFDLVCAYRDWLAEAPPSALRTLLHVLLLKYPMEEPAGDVLRAELARVLARAEGRSLQRWTKRCKEYGLLRADGLGRFGKLLLQAADPHEVLQAAGFDGGLLRCEFLRHVAHRVLDEAGVRLRGEEVGALQERLFRFLELDGQLRFNDPETRSRLAKGLLDPYTARPPEAPVRNVLFPFFRRHFGHPHLNAGRWHGIEDDLRKVALRWWIEETLELFVQVVKEFALDRHWRYRERFWRAFHDAGFIDDAWFVFGPRATGMIRSIPGHSGEDVGAVHARLTGADNSQSVLLLRMPGLTIAEWSHNGSCRIWLDGHENQPPLHKRSYDASMLRASADFTQPHFLSEMGRWQRRVASYIEANTGAAVSRRKYAFL